MGRKASHKNVLGRIDMFEKIIGILRDSLQLGAAANNLTLESALIGHIPEFDSMAVVTVLTMVEEEFGIDVEDDEVSADVFETVGTLVAFVNEKVEAEKSG